nr:XK-related protein 7-like [Cherax quadricarinatus]
MSKVRPTKSPQPCPGDHYLLVLTPKRKKTRRSAMASPSEGAPASSEDTMLKPTGNYSSEGGYGTINPHFAFTDKVAMPPGLPNPLIPIIPTSYSMPTLATTITNLLSPQQTHTDVFYNVAPLGSDPNPLNTVLSPPPNTPLSPLSIPSSPTAKNPGYNPPRVFQPPNPRRLPLHPQLKTEEQAEPRSGRRDLLQGINYLTQPEDTLEFGWLDALTGIISIITFYFDLVSDVLVAYYMRDDPASKNWFLAALLLLLLPMVVANGFSLYWYWFDERSCEPQYSPRHPRVPNYVWTFRVAAHLLLQAPVLRQVDIIYYGTKSTAETALQEALVDEVMEAALVSTPQDHSDTHKDSPSRRSSTRLSRSSAATSKRPVSACSVRTGGVCARGGYLALWIHAERDASNVELLLALVQDAPLLILHLYIMAHTLPSQALQGHISDTLVMQMLSVTMSLLTLAWSVASFVRASRMTEPSLGNLSILDLLLITLSHFCSIAAQVMSFSLFASKLEVVFFIIVTLHWLLMSTWVLAQLLFFPRTTCTRAFFFHDRQEGLCHWLDDVLYSAVMGLVFLFTFVDVGGVAARIQGLLYHVLTLLEQMILLALWLLWTTGWAWYYWVPLILSPLLFCLSLIFEALFTAHAKPDRCQLLTSSPKAV